MQQNTGECALQISGGLQINRSNTPGAGLTVRKTPIVTEGLILYLDASNETSYPGTGTTWSDLSSSGSDATLVNTTFNSGNGGRLSFSGTQYVTIPTGYTGSTWTLLIWHLNEGPTEFANVGHRTYSSTDTMRFQWDDNTSATSARGPFVDFTAAVGAGQAMYANPVTPDFIFNNWHMIGIIADTTSVKTFYNKNTTGQASVIGASRQFSTNGTLNLGLDNLSGIGGGDVINRDGGDVYIPVCMLYNRALSNSEITQNYNAFRGKYLG